MVGGADAVRQALAAGYVRELTITIAPVILGDGKRLFEGFDRSIDLEQTRAPFVARDAHHVPRPRLIRSLLDGGSA